MSRFVRVAVCGAIAISTGCAKPFFVMDGEATQTLSGSDHVGVVTNGKGMDYVRKAIESGLMNDGVHVQAIHIEDIKDDFYKREEYDVITDVVKLQRKLDISTNSYAGLGDLQGINDYTLRHSLASDSLTFLDDLRTKWDLDYILVVRQNGGFSFDSYLIDSNSREKLFTLYVNSNKKGFFKNFPDTKNRPSIDEWDGTNDGDLARQEVARYIVQTLVKGAGKKGR